MSDSNLAVAADQRSLFEQLGLSFMQQFPLDAARELELLPPRVTLKLLSQQQADVMQSIWSRFVPDYAVRTIPLLDDEQLLLVLQSLDAGRCANLLMKLEKQHCEYCLKQLPESLSDELRELLTYPEDSAGRLMDKRVPAFHRNMRVANVARQLKLYPANLLQRIYVLDDSHGLIGYIDLARLVQADPDRHLETLMKPVPAMVTILDPKSVISEQLNLHRVDSLPVVDAHNHLVGLIYADRLIESLKEDLATNMQTMVGVSKDERALSSSWFAVRKRQGWLQINLLTGFLAAAVVGLFESTIAQFTALAILMPVAAGQSGNTGAQALAVTMRGLTLREVSIGQWYKVMLKEAGAGLVNGSAIAITCGLGVYLWSRSFGLSLVIALAMIISMTIAGVSGALVPMALKKFGLDPAQSSSIILTTITDVAGFMSFLGIAALLSNMLVAG